MAESTGVWQTPPGLQMKVWPMSHQPSPGFESAGMCGGVYSPHMMAELENSWEPPREGAPDQLEDNGMALDNEDN